MGIEPTFLAWEANVLPLNYTRGRANSKRCLRQAQTRRRTFDSSMNRLIRHPHLLQRPRVRAADDAVQMEDVGVHRTDFVVPRRGESWQLVASAGHTPCSRLNFRIRRVGGCEWRTQSCGETIEIVQMIPTHANTRHSGSRATNMIDRATGLRRPSKVTGRAKTGILRCTSGALRRHMNQVCGARIRPRRTSSSGRVRAAQESGAATYMTSLCTSS